MISGVAQGFSMIAIPWYFARSMDMGRFSLIYILTNCIALLWVPYAGTFVDKYDRRKIFLFINLIIGSIVLTIAGIGQMQGTLSWILVAAVFMVTFFNYNIHYPTMYAFVQEITEPKYYKKLASALEVQGQIATMSAGAGAALLLEGTMDGKINLFGIMVSVPFDIAPWKIYEIFTLDGATYLVSLIIIYLIRYVPIAVRKSEVGGAWERIRIGYQYLKEHKIILLFGVTSYAIFVTLLVCGFYLFPIYVKNHLQEAGDVYAALDMYYGAGAIFAGFAIHWIFRRMEIPNAIAVLSFIFGVSCILLAGTRSVVILYLVALIMGIGNAGSRVLRVTYLFRHVPNQVYGRANSLLVMTNICFRIVFLLLFAAPFFLLENHVIYAFVIMGIFLAISGMILIYFRNDFNALG